MRGLVGIWIIEGGPQSFYKGSPGGEGEFPGARIQVGLEPGSRGPGKVGRGIGDFAGFCGVLAGSELNIKLSWVMKVLYCDQVPSNGLGGFSFVARVRGSGAGAGGAGAGVGATVAWARAANLCRIPHRIPRL